MGTSYGDVEINASATERGLHHLTAGAAGLMDVSEELLHTGVPAAAFGGLPVAAELARSYSAWSAGAPREARFVGDGLEECTTRAHASVVALTDAADESADAYRTLRARHA